MDLKTKQNTSENSQNSFSLPASPSSQNPYRLTLFPNFVLFFFNKHKHHPVPSFPRTPKARPAPEGDPVSFPGRERGLPTWRPGASRRARAPGRRSAGRPAGTPCAGPAPRRTRPQAPRAPRPCKQAAARGSDGRDATRPRAHRPGGGALFPALSPGDPRACAHLTPNGGRSRRGGKAPPTGWSAQAHRALSGRPV